MIWGPSIHDEILRGTPLISLSSLGLSLPPPSPVSLPAIFASLPPLLTWQGWHKDIQTRAAGSWLVRGAQRRLLIGHRGQDVSRHASLRDDSGAGTSLGSLRASAQLWVWQIRKGGGRKSERTKRPLRKYQGGILLSCYCSPISPFFNFLFSEMHLIIVSDAEPTCSIPRFLCNIAAQSYIFYTRNALPRVWAATDGRDKSQSSLNRIIVSAEEWIILRDFSKTLL